MTNREAIAILELQIPLSHEDVRKAFRRMAKIYHPDLQREPEKQEEASKKFIGSGILKKVEEVLGKETDWSI